MNQLWAPWRMKYLESIDKKDQGCIFCTKPKQNNDKENLILYRGDYCFVLMNLYPYNNGHLMVVPYEHTSNPLSLTEATSAEIWQLLNRSQQVLTDAFHPEGFNIGMNVGRAAGAGIDQHIHLHIVPRWNGDTNFFPVIGETKVISQSLEDTWTLLSEKFRIPG